MHFQAVHRYGFVLNFFHFFAVVFGNFAVTVEMRSEFVEMTKKTINTNRYPLSSPPEEMIIRFNIFFENMKFDY